MINVRLKVINFVAVAIQISPHIGLFLRYPSVATLGIMDLPRRIAVEILDACFLVRNVIAKAAKNVNVMTFFATKQNADLRREGAIVTLVTDL